MQAKPQIIAYLAYEETPKATLIAYETKSCLIAMLGKDETGTLEHRLFIDAQQQNKTALVLELLEQQKTPDAELILERWVKI